MRGVIGFLCWILVLFLVFSCESTASIRNIGEGGAAGEGPGNTSGEGGSQSGGDAGAPAAGMAGRAGEGGGAGQPPGGTAGVPSAGAAGQESQLANGLLCANDDNCSSNYCADGVCCNEACDGACRACVEESTGMADGKCGFVQSGLDPDDDCAEGNETCREDGLCDGNGGCRLAGTDTECGAESCASGSYTPPSHCDGQGACDEASPISCEGYPCRGSQCNIPCGNNLACPDALYCDGAGRCQPKKNNGVSCDGGPECTSGYCVQGVCCDGDCTGSCRSCLALHTGSQQGRCAPVAGGTDPLNDCNASAASTCQNDGACNGQGECRLHAQGTVCGAKDCQNGANQSTEYAARTCNGDGVCSSAGGGNSCGLLRCGSDECRDSCSQTSHCVPGYYCDSPSCRPKKFRGDVCGGPDQCDSGICGGSEPNVRGGRCCAIPCDCPQPSAQNLLENPGFEEDLAGWDVDLEDNFPDAPADAEWSNLWDADSCGDGDSYSGGLDVTIGEISHVTVRQCVPASAGVTYNMGGWFLATELPEGHPSGDAPWNATCSVEFFSSMNVCNTGFPNLGVQSVTLHNEIQSTYTWKAFSASAVAPASTTAAAFDCFMIDDFAPEMSVLLDKVYLSPSPAQY